MFLQLILAKLHNGEYLLSAAIECEVCQKSEWKQCRNKHKKIKTTKTFHFLIIQLASLISCFIFGVFQRTLIDKQREITQLSKEGFNLSRTTVVLCRWKLLQGKKKEICEEFLSWRLSFIPSSARVTRGWRSKRQLWQLSTIPTL